MNVPTRVSMHAGDVGAVDAVEHARRFIHHNELTSW